MFSVYQDMRLSRSRRMASGLVNQKLEDCHMKTTVSPTQVKIKNFLSLIRLIKIFKLRYYRNRNFPQFEEIYDEEYMDDWIKLANTNGDLPREHTDELAQIVFNTRW